MLHLFAHWDPTDAPHHPLVYINSHTRGANLGIYAESHLCDFTLKITVWVNCHKAENSWHSLFYNGVKCLNLGVTVLYKLQSNRFYKNTRAIRKEMGDKKRKQTACFFVLSPKSLGQLSCPLWGRESIGLSLNWSISRGAQCHFCLFS